MRVKYRTPDGNRITLECAPVSNNMMSYNEAVLYCRFLKFNGHIDWRMPTRDEYMQIKTLPGWYVGRVSDYWHNPVYTVSPVRDTTKTSEQL
jgi:hypothetical protein